jgi:hypothetical protein
MNLQQANAVNSQNGVNTYQQSPSNSLQQSGVTIQQNGSSVTSLPTQNNAIQQQMLKQQQRLMQQQVGLFQLIENDLMRGIILIFVAKKVSYTDAVWKLHVWGFRDRFLDLKIAAGLSRVESVGIYQVYSVKLIGLAAASTAATAATNAATADSGKPPEEPGCSVASVSRPAGLWRYPRICFIRLVATVLLLIFQLHFHSVSVVMLYPWVFVYLLPAAAAAAANVGPIYWLSKDGCFSEG